MSELTKENLLHFLRDFQSEIAIHHGFTEPAHPKETAGEARMLRSCMFSLVEEIIYRLNLDDEPRRPS